MTYLMEPDAWETMLENALKEEYVPCTAVINGEPWGLFVALKEIGDAFLRRNFGGRGKLYKPDYKRREDENSDVALVYTGGYGDFLLAADTFKDFCLLRAKSVRGQLEGTIPSTIKGQEWDKSAFIEASHIRIEDMGELADMMDEKFLIYGLRL